MVVLEAPTESDRFTVEETASERAYSFVGIRRRRSILECVRRQATVGVPLIVDGGANIGASSLVLAALFPTAQVIAVEPDERNANLLHRNCRDCPNISLIAEAIGPTDGEAMLCVDDNPRGHHVAPEGTVRVRVISIDTILARVPEAVPFMLKLDIEGAEQQLFEHDAKWIDRFPVIVIEPHDWKYPKTGLIRGFLQNVAARDRDFLIVGENIVSISNTLVG